jgi:hypothetical protein
MDLVIDVMLVAILGLVTWLLANEGAWTAILAFFAVVFGGLIAMNCFEPLAEIIGTKGGWLETRADFLSFIGLFALFTFLIRMGLDNVAPTNLELPDIAYQASRWIFAFATGYITMAIVLTSLHTAPLPRNFMGFTPERTRYLFIGLSPDRQWLGFTQYVTEHIGRRQRIRNEHNQEELPYRNFDGLRFIFPNGSQTEYLPTFIIRYASRRDQIGGMVAAPVAAPVVSGGGGAPAKGPQF